ncbi:MAG: CinA family protein [Candidatus Xiphinematobacter sp.]|nr:MAG: CinA family protein [Candidatus Xiphinematobacter sp.]QQY10478.1 MAG: CinA family protein [Candidatus Xiphinematobacter sp.]
MRRGPLLERMVVECLRRAKRTLATAESCTGGLLANRITNVEGCSRVFLEGFILYSDKAKSDRLHLPESTIRSCGAVSKEVATEMAERLLNLSGAHYALCTTGVAGPTRGTQQLSIGTVFIGLASPQVPTQVYRGLFPESRETFKQLAVDAALGILYRRLLDA